MKVNLSVFLKSPKYLVRKTAHVILYCGLYALTTLAFIRKPNRYRTYLKIFVFCVLYACFDEVYQTFIPGRTGLVQDVLIDSIGINSTSNAKPAVCNSGNIISEASPLMSLKPHCVSRIFRSRKSWRRVRKTKLPTFLTREEPSRAIPREPMTTSKSCSYQGSSLLNSLIGVDWSISVKRTISPLAFWMPVQTAAGLPP